MAALISHKSESNYLSFDNRKPPYKSVIVRYQYEPVNIYDIKSDRREKNKFPAMFECLKKFCCCRSQNVTEGENYSPIEDPNSSLVGPIGRSYTLSSQAKPTQAVPTVTITRAIDNESTINSTAIKTSDNDSLNSNTSKDECIKSTTKLLLTKEREISSRHFYKVHVEERDRRQETEVDSRTSTLRSGEKMSFIREVLSCRDTFLKSLEWCDNSLMRSKRCRHVKSDEWLELRVDGISAL